MMIPFVVVSLGLLIAVFWVTNYTHEEPVKLPMYKKPIESGFHDTLVNTNIAYLYVHKKTGELKVHSVPRDQNFESDHANIRNKGYEVIDVWWEPNNE